MDSNDKSIQTVSSSIQSTDERGNQNGSERIDGAFGNSFSKGRIIAIAIVSVAVLAIGYTLK